MAEASLAAKPREGTSSTLLLVIGALMLAVIAADLASPLGLAVWVFYIAKPFEVDELVSLCRVWLPR